jgi:hypothetical protein
MRNELPTRLELARIQLRGYPPTKEGDMHGAFYAKARKLNIMSGGRLDPDWEHVSVSRSDRCPTWNEMCIVKDLFWDEDETVIQFHPKKSDYINDHPFCLHLWKKVSKDYELPPQIFV